MERQSFIGLQGKVIVLISLVNTIEGVISFLSVLFFSFRFVFNLGHAKIVKLLIEHGAEVNAKSMDGLTALHWAAKNGDSLNLSKP